MTRVQEIIELTEKRFVFNKKNTFENDEEETSFNIILQFITNLITFSFRIEAHLLNMLTLIDNLKKLFIENIVLIKQKK